jgi:hypothetical protein
MSVLVVKNLINSQVSLDGGSKRAAISPYGEIALTLRDVIYNYDFCNQLAYYINNSVLAVYLDSVLLTGSEIISIGSGNDTMIKSIYDKDLDSVSDSSQSLSYGGSDFDYADIILEARSYDISSHNDLTNRDSLNSHPISSISNLGTSLDQKIDSEDAKVYAGFENRSDSSIGMSGNFFEITTASSYVVYFNGLGKKEITTNLQIEITHDRTITYIYLDWHSGAIRINKSTAVWDLSLGDRALTAIVFKDGASYAVTDERHGYNRDLSWHKWAHNNIGTLYNSGLSGVFTDTTLSLSQGIIYDEDLKFDTGGTKTTATLWYRDSGSGMRMERGSTTPYKDSAGVLQWDNGSGTLQPVGNNQYSAQWVYASNDLAEPIYVVLGQSSGNLNSIRNSTPPVINLSTAEWKLLYRVIYRNVSSSPVFIEAADYRGVQTGVAVSAPSPSSHSSLIDRDAVNSHPASAISYDDGSAVLTNVQTFVNNHASPYEAVSVSSTTYSVTKTSGEIVILCNTTANDIDIYLPTAVGNKAKIIIKNVGGANSLLITADGSETIDGSLSVSLNTVYYFANLVSDNSNWHIV